MNKPLALTIIASALFFIAFRPSDDFAIASHASQAASAEHQTVTAIAHPHAITQSSGNGRNLFAYVAPAPKAIAVAPVHRAIETPIAPPPVIAQTPRVPEAPRFPYRYIGRFGHDANPIAAFARDGEIVTVRRGEAVGEGFTLRTIGIESVEVESRGAVQRVALNR